MKNSSNPASGSTEQDAGSPPVVETSNTSPRSLARQIAGRTTDLLAIAILTIAGLTIGRQTLVWWRESPPQVRTEQQDSQAWGVDGLPVTIQFGSNPLTLSREVVTGTAQTATDHLFDRCREQLATAQPRTKMPDESELRTLASLENWKPRYEQGSEWKLYGVPGGLTTVVGVRYFPDWNPSAPGNIPTNAGALSFPRVVCWGTVFPIGPQQWTVFVFLPDGNSERTSTIPNIELPSGANRTLVLQSATGQTMLSFQGRGDPTRWMQHFTKQFESRGWRQQSEWQVTETAWHARFSTKEPNHGKQAVEAEVEVRFYKEPAKGMLGLITTD